MRLIFFDFHHILKGDTRRCIYVKCIFAQLKTVVIVDKLFQGNVPAK